MAQEFFSYFSDLFGWYLSSYFLAFLFYCLRSLLLFFPLDLCDDGAKEKQNLILLGVYWETKVYRDLVKVQLQQEQIWNRDWGGVDTLLYDTRDMVLLIDGCDLTTNAYAWDSRTMVLSRMASIWHLHNAKIPVARAHRYKHLKRNPCWHLMNTQIGLRVCVVS